MSSYAELVRRRRQAETKMDEMIAEQAAIDAELAALYPLPQVDGADWQVALTAAVPGEDTRWARTKLAEATIRSVSIVHITHQTPTTLYVGCHLGDDRVAFQVTARMKPFRIDVMPTERAKVAYRDG